MKIGYLCTDPYVSVDGPEGCSVHIRSLTSALLDAGHEVFIMAVAGGSKNGFNIPVHCLHSGELDRLMIKALEQEPLIEAERLGRDLTALIETQALTDAASNIIRNEQPDILYERYSLFGSVGARLAQRHSLPLILEVNAPLCIEQRGYELFRLENVAELIEQEVLRRADAVLVVSDWLKQWALKEGVPTDRLTVIPNGVTAKTFQRTTRENTLRHSLNLKGMVVIGYVGSFQPWHDIEGLLLAFEQIVRSRDDVRLLLVGPDKRLAKIRRLISQRDLTERVVLTGHVPHEEVPQYLQIMDMTVVPYRAMDDVYFSPLKLFESLAAGCPTVAASVGQITQIITHQRTGWFYKPGDLSSLVDALQTLIAAPELRAKIGQAGRELVLNNYTWEAIAQRVVSIAERLLHKSSDGQSNKRGFQS